MRCLLIEDEPGIREGLAALMRLRGHEVHTAADVATGKALLSQHEFDLVLSDWRLPDATAEALYAHGSTPIVVISGHPEEVVPSKRLFAVLGKPLMPDTLFELLSRRAAAVAAAVPTPPAPSPSSLPVDVRTVAERAIVLLAGNAVELRDDGTYVTLRCDRVDAERAARLEDLGGDLRTVRTGDGRLQCELRWCRDGRPDPGLPVATPNGLWPASREFAVDFHGTEATAETFLAVCERAEALRHGGVIVHFLNVPAELRRQVEQSGRPVRIPAARPIGPRLPSDLAGLWH